MGRKKEKAEERTRAEEQHRVAEARKRAEEKKKKMEAAERAEKDRKAAREKKAAAKAAAEAAKKTAVPPAPSFAQTATAPAPAPAPSAAAARLGRTQDGPRQGSNVTFAMLHCVKQDKETQAITIDGRRWDDAANEAKLAYALQMQKNGGQPLQPLEVIDFGEFAAAFLYVKYNDGLQYVGDNNNGSVHPSAYGATEADDLYMCFAVFCTNNACPYGRKCRYRHTPLLLHEVRAILSGWQPGFVSKYLGHYARPALPEDGGIPLPPAPPGGFCR
jgi:hypothetical protein